MHVPGSRIWFCQLWQMTEPIAESHDENEGDAQIVKWISFSSHWLEWFGPNWSNLRPDALRCVPCKYLSRNNEGWFSNLPLYRIGHQKSPHCRDEPSDWGKSGEDIESPVRIRRGSVEPRTMDLHYKSTNHCIVCVNTLENVRLNAAPAGLCSTMRPHPGVSTALLGLQIWWWKWRRLLKLLTIHHITSICDWTWRCWDSLIVFVGHRRSNLYNIM